MKNYFIQICGCNIMRFLRYIDEEESSRYYIHKSG